MTHPNELDQQVDNLRTLQQSYDQIASAAEAYNTGKVELAQNITSKGVEASATETLPELAEKVAAISQETYEINGGEMYAKQLFGSLETPNYWNLYEVLANLLSDGRLVSYGGILLAEYYRGYDSLALAGAGAGGAYVVSDKDENGQFKMYTEDTTHTWATEFDGKGNRWVAYCFADEYHDFQITDTNTSPRSIFIGRKVGTITNLANGRTSQVVVTDGSELTNINQSSFSQNYGRVSVFRNIKKAGPLFFRAKGDHTQELIYLESDEIYAVGGGGCIQGAGDIENNIQTIIVKSDKITGLVFHSGNNFGGKLTIIECPYITTENNSKLTFGAKKDTSVLYLKTEFCECSLAGGNDCAYVRVYIGYITNDKTKEVLIYSFGEGANATYVELQDGWCKPLNISALSGTSETEDKIYAHILQKLKQDEPDCGDGVTITLGAMNLAKLTSQESVDLLDALTNTYGYTFA